MSNVQYIHLFETLTSTKSPGEQKRRFLAWAKDNGVNLDAAEELAIYKAADRGKLLTTNKTSARIVQKGEVAAFYVRNRELALCTRCEKPIELNEPVFLELLVSGAVKT